METRRFGRTGHMSTVAIFGAAAFSNVSQEDADKAMERIIEAGVNHIDIARSYGEAEQELAHGCHASAADFSWEAKPRNAQKKVPGRNYKSHSNACKLRL